MQRHAKTLGVVTEGFNDKLNHAGSNPAALTL